MRLIKTFTMLNMLLYTFSCTAQNNTSTMSNQNNPLLCNPETGVCELLDSTSTQTNTLPNQHIKPITITYFTDPICSSCWGIEPQLRKLKLAYGPHVQVNYHMGGLLPDWSYNKGGISKPSDVAHHWDEVSAYYQMPIDGDIWLEDPLASSYPPSIAFKAAQLQNEEKALVFLRLMREMVFLEKKNIAKWEQIEQAALQANLNTQLLKNDMALQGKTNFEADLELSRKLGVRGFPTLLISNGKQQEIIYGFRPYSQFENAMRKLAPTHSALPYDSSWSALFAAYPTLTLREFAELSNISMAAATQELNHLVETQKLTVFKTKNGNIYRLVK